MRRQAVSKFAVALVGFVSASTVLGLWSNVTQALTISPVVVELSPDRRITSITRSNPADRPVSFQTQTLAWSQSDGADVYADSDELIVVPPIAEIDAGESQIFCVTFRAVSAPQERAYRLIFGDVTETVEVLRDKRRKRRLLPYVQSTNPQRLRENARAPEFTTHYDQKSSSAAMEAALASLVDAGHFHSLRNAMREMSGSKISRLTASSQASLISRRTNSATRRAIASSTRIGGLSVDAEGPAAAGDCQFIKNADCSQARASDVGHDVFHHARVVSSATDNSFRSAGVPPASAASRFDFIFSSVRIVIFRSDCDTPYSVAPLICLSSSRL
jgi:hypothetical protein